MAAPQHLLVVVRHAKAEQSAPTDYERALVERGRGDAAALGTWLAGAGVVPDLALVSAAPRAAQTWDALACTAGWAVEPRLDRGLYTAGPETALDLVRAADDTARTLVVVGHNPTMASVAQLLDDGDGDLDAGNQMALGFPTSAAAVFEVSTAWADLGSARLVGFHVGRG